MGFPILEPGDFVKIYVPCHDTYLVFQVVKVLNRGFEVLNYGLIPLSSGDTVNDVVSGTKTVPANGVLPARSWVSIMLKPLTWMKPHIDSEVDLLFVESEKKNVLMHCYVVTTPGFIKMLVEIPRGYQRVPFRDFTQPYSVLDSDIKPALGFVETISIPGVHQNVMFMNWTNIDLYVYITLIYGYYNIIVPSNPEVIYNVLSNKVKNVHEVVFSYYTSEPGVNDALRKWVGSFGISANIHILSKEKALKQIEEFLTKVPKEIRGGE